MKTIYFVLIFLILGAIVGSIIGLNYQPTCSVDPVTEEIAACMGDPRTYYAIGAIIGSVSGIIIGFIIGLILNRKK